MKSKLKDTEQNIFTTDITFPILNHETKEIIPHHLRVMKAIANIYPRKSEALNQLEWSSEMKIFLSKSTFSRSVDQLSSFLWVVSNNDTKLAYQLINSVFVENDKLIGEKKKYESNSIENEIISNIQKNICCIIKKENGRKITNEKQAMNAILTACIGAKEKNMEAIRQRLGASKSAFYNIEAENTKQQLYMYKERKPREGRFTLLHKRCIRDFCHSDTGSRNDSNCKTVVKVPSLENNSIVEKHAGRVWEVATLDEQYALFQQSDIAKNI